MLLLIMDAGGARYGVAASQVDEVIPVPVLRSLAGMPPFISGVFSYHGTLVPVLDLSMLLADRPSQQFLSTRILRVRLQRSGDNDPVLVGLMAEHATETVECNPEEFQSAGVHGCSKPYTGSILIRPEGLIQQLHVESLLTAELREQLLAGACGM